MDAAAPVNITAAGAAVVSVVDAATLLGATSPPSPLSVSSTPVTLDNLASLHSFYMASHATPVNWAIHAAAVPVLKVSILLLLAAATAGRGTTSSAAKGAPSPPRFFSTDAGLAMAAAYVAFYASLSPAIGTFAAVVFGAEWLAARAVLAAAGRRRAAVVGLLGVAATQVAMVAGHRAWEGAPQAIVAGPAAALAAAPLCMQLDVAVWAGWPRVAAALAATA